MTGARWIPVALWTGVILTGTSVPSVPGPAVPGLDKVGHFAMYAVRKPFAAATFAFGRNGFPVSTLAMMSSPIRSSACRRRSRS